MGLTVGGTHYHVRHGEVTILELRPGCSLDVKVWKAEHADTFWTRSIDFPDGFYQERSEGRLVQTLLAGRYSLNVSVPNDDEWLRSMIEYKEWSGEDLDDESVKLRGKRCLVNRREWRLRFKLCSGMVVPFRLSAIGTSMNINRNDVLNEQGVLYPGGHVDVFWASIVERLVRLGLRVTGGTR